MTRQAFEVQLDALQHESQARRAELQAIAVELPDATSRRALVISMFRSLGAAPNKADVGKRLVLKVLRTPADLVRRARGG